MSERNNNVEQTPGCAEPQAPKSISVESVDDGMKPLNKPVVEEKKSVFN